MPVVRSLRGHLLVAGPALVDPNFRRTVVLLGEHGDEGAMGVVLNRVSTALVDDAVPPIAALTGPDERVYLGGPVQPQAVVVLADFADAEQAEVVVVDNIGFLPGEIEDAAEVGELRGVRVFAGYAGWGPGQLDEELAQSAWLMADVDLDLVFDVDASRMWETAIRRLGADPSALQTSRGVH
jgi:putative transcriptional regulator